MHVYTFVYLFILDFYMVSNDSSKDLKSKVQFVDPGTNVTYY